jgi:hypothetical protein
MVHSDSLGCDLLEIERWYAGGFAIGTAAAKSAKIFRGGVASAETPATPRQACDVEHSALREVNQKN